MKKIIYVFVLFIMVSLSQFITAQSVKLGFRVEPGILITEKNNSNNVSPVLLSFYSTCIFEPVDWLGLEFRPGILLASEDYSGFEIGGFIRLKILPSKFFIIMGINNHSNQGSGHSGGGSYKKDMLYKGVGIGYQKDSKLSFDLVYFWTNNQAFSYSRETEPQIYLKFTDKNMKGILKIGLSLAWDIF